LPERVHEDRATGSSAIIQETDAKYFSWLLRVTRINGRQKQGCKYEEKIFSLVFPHPGRRCVVALFLCCDKP